MCEPASNVGDDGGCVTCDVSVCDQGDQNNLL